MIPIIRLIVASDKLGVFLWIQKHAVAHGPCLCSCDSLILDLLGVYVKTLLFFCYASC
jgi:hypothetical protein